MQSYSEAVHSVRGQLTAVREDILKYEEPEKFCSTSVIHNLPLSSPTIFNISTGIFPLKAHGLSKINRVL